MKLKPKFWWLLLIPASSLYAYFILSLWIQGKGSVLGGSQASQKCGAHTCGAKDAVSDPAYNVRQVVENSILLEDHLTDKNKLCNDCICKHFLAIHGYATEALTLAGQRVRDYPHLTALPGFYDNLYQKWRKDKNNERVRLEIDTELRAMRKQLMVAYSM